MKYTVYIDYTNEDGLTKRKNFTNTEAANRWGDKNLYDFKPERVKIH